MHTDARALIELKKLLKGNPIASNLLHDLEGDLELQSLIAHGNNIVVKRLNYNDHGRVHSLISSLNSLKILDLLNQADIEPTLAKEGDAGYGDAQMVVLASAYLHDIGDAVSRDMHYYHGVCLASEPLRRLLERYYTGKRLHVMRAAILEGIFTHDEEVECTSIEGGCVTIGDGTDMEHGRARIPYILGKSDIHAFSALAIDRVTIEKGKDRPVRIMVDMKNPAGVFQVERVLGEKVRSSGPVKRYVEVVGNISGKFKTFMFD
jgi:metal-dependent HD superfamily phosphatase/phosphodiesterase